LAEVDRLRREIVIASATAGEGHIPSALSILDILWIEYSVIMASQRMRHEEIDRFVLSKGHGALALYVVLSETGAIDKSELGSFGQFESRLGGHPDRLKIPGVEASTGSLGHGMPIAAGIALAKQIQKSEGRVVTLIGDGEANEGTIWETALIAAHQQLNNLVCIVDYNHSTDRALMVGSITGKFAAFGWDVVEIDGHDPFEIEESLSREKTTKPLAVIANTIKGKGVKAMENNPAWHHAAPRIDEVKNLLGDN